LIAQTFIHCSNSFTLHQTKYDEPVAVHKMLLEASSSWKWLVPYWHIVRVINCSSSASRYYINKLSDKIIPQYIRG